LAILDQLHTVKKDKNESMIDYFSRINEIISKLKSLDYTVNHDDWRLFMLRGLKNDERYIDDVEWIRKIDDKNEWDKEKLEQYFIKQEMNMKINNKSTTVKKVESEDTNKSKVEIAAASVGDNDNHQNYRHNNNNRNHRGGYRGRGNFRSRGGFRGRGGRGRRGGYNSRGGYRNNYHNNHRHENQNKNNDSEEVEESRKRKNDGIICHKCGRANHI
jgi:hypothetical protein